MADNSLAPVSWASIIIGFVSFAFTLSTFFKVIAGNLNTLSKAPEEVPFYLSNLKQELFEERLHLRRARRRTERNLRRCRRNGIALPTWDSGPSIRLLEATVRLLCKQFKELERPFLIDRGDNGSGRGNPAKTLEEGVKEREKEVWDDYMDGGFEQDYGTVTLYHRWSWLSRKSAVIKMGGSLEKLQIRRIARETTDALNELKVIKTDLQDLKLIPGEHETVASTGYHGGGGGGGGGARSGTTGGSHRRHGSSKGRGRTVRDSPASTSDSSESSDFDDEKTIAREKTERVHVRRTRYRVT